MKKDTWKMVIQIAISILTAIATSLEFRAACSSRKAESKIQESRMKSAWD